MLTHKDRAALLKALSDSPQFDRVNHRQATVRNALSGYPLSEEIYKALRFLDWEGAPFVVADQLVRLLDGREVAPGVPALEMIAQAVGALPAENWRDQRAPAEVVRERIIGENTLRPMYYLRRALVAADAVVRVDMNGVPHGTGFLVAPNLMMTNNHVIGSAEEAANARVFFFDDVADAQGIGEPAKKQVMATCATLLYTDADLDYSLVRLQGAPELLRYLPPHPVTVKVNTRVVIIQHPGGYPKQISLQNNLVAAVVDDKLVQYYTSTKGGSSGSPVLDEEFAAVAIHHSYVHNRDWSGGGQIRLTDPKQIDDLQYRNQGTSMIAIVKDLENAAPGLLAEIRDHR